MIVKSALLQDATDCRLIRNCLFVACTDLAFFRGDRIKKIFRFNVKFENLGTLRGQCLPLLQVHWQGIE